MGWLYTEGMITPDGATHGKIELDTVACGHCGGVIKIVKKGVLEAYATRFRCDKCNRKICRYCATQKEKNQGACAPLMQKIEDALRGQGWNSKLFWIPKFIPTGLSSKHATGRSIQSAVG